MNGDSSDSDAPEEITAEEGVKQYENIRKIQTKSALRVAQEGKERRRLWGQRNTRAKPNKVDVAEVTETEELEKESTVPGMLPSNIVDLLTAREKKTFSSDSEEELVNRNKATSNKKKQKISGPETVILKEIPPAQCFQNSIDFLKRRKMQVARSSAVLKHSKALHLLSSRGSLSNKS